MMHGKTFKTALTIAVVIGVAFAAPQGNNNELNNVSIYSIKIDRTLYLTSVPYLK